MDDRKEPRNVTQSILAMGIMLGFFSSLGVLLFVDLPATGHDALLLMLGALIGALGEVRSFYFGSSKGSDQTKDIIQSMVDKTPNAKAANTVITTVEKVTTTPDVTP